ncbi:copper homeostasis protein CutC [Saccharicrinis aurantiacus]|uniref:copper homeostasis protein CutC n=1 Tax=Saccharicrinis aurantiacus TaxID=1849719 RepID=UPI0008392480|nr:copper homeostasis protein CutC [Saccharicrinis aurantiacus]
MFKLEVSTYNIEGVKAALKLGVDRLELCNNIKEGGTTPSAGFVKAAIETGHPDIFIIVRPRGGDFLYSDSEFEVIKSDIELAKLLGVHGVVSGVLNADGSIDIKRTKELVELARPMKFTFHRAFDMSNDPKKALDDLIEIGVDIVLSSGMEDTAVEGRKTLQQMIQQANNRITVLVGSGVNASNIAQLQKETGATEFHMSAVKEIKSEMEFFNHRLNMGNVESEEYSKLTVDTEKITAALSVIKQLK